MNTDEKYAALQTIGESAAESISDMVAALNVSYERLDELRDTAKNDPDEMTQEDKLELAELAEMAGDCTSEEDARRRIEEDPLEVLMRGDWYAYGTEPADAAKPVEFRILLSTGGPATRIIGELNEHGEPTRARIQAQDWFTVWTDYTGDTCSQDDLLTYCGHFFFGQ